MKLSGFIQSRCRHFAGKDPRSKALAAAFCSINCICLRLRVKAKAFFRTDTSVQKQKEAGETSVSPARIIGDAFRICTETVAVYAENGRRIFATPWFSA